MTKKDKANIPKIMEGIRYYRDHLLTFDAKDIVDIEYKGDMCQITLCEGEFLCLSTINVPIKYIRREEC